MSDLFIDPRVDCTACRMGMDGLFERLRGYMEAPLPGLDTVP
jgi:hypothetical protein